MKVITLLTDFGLKDGYAGLLKGVIWTIAPDVQITDLSHSIPPQDVFSGALTLMRCVPYFPPGTVHIAVVDPGVGTSRRALAAQIGKHYFIGPDNGIFSHLIEPAKSAGEPVHFFSLDQPRYWLPDVSPVFHGRDIFAPVGAHLANGVPIEQLGSRITDPVMIILPRPSQTEYGWIGEVIHVDTFGNLATNITLKEIAPLNNVVVKISQIKILGISKAFGDRLPGEPVALIDSAGWLSLAVVNGNAAQAWSAGIESRVEVIKTL